MSRFTNMVNQSAYKENSDKDCDSTYWYANHARIILYIKTQGNDW